MGDWREKPEDCWQDISKKLLNPIRDWKKKPTEENDMEELIDSIGAKIAQFLAGMWVIQRDKAQLFFVRFVILVFWAVLPCFYLVGLIVGLTIGGTVFAEGKIAIGLLRCSA